jgi:AcrR family transcriptional regulator
MAETHARLIEATINCLYRVGYSATTVSLVAEEAQVSRGAITHHFPAKQDLMVAVVSEVFRRDIATYTQTIRAMGAKEWLRQMPIVGWEVMSRAPSMAVVEIMLASRSDRSLAAKLRTMQTRIDDDVKLGMADVRQEAGVTPREDDDAVHHLFVAAVRGLAIESLFMQNRSSVHQSVNALAEALAHLYPELKR